MESIERVLDGRSVRRVRLIAPIVTLVAFALLSIVLAAHAGLAFCTNRVALAAPGMGGSDEMPGMSMTALPGITAGAVPHAAYGHSALMICPVVLVLIIASMLLAAAAGAVVWTDPDRVSSAWSVVRSLARLPLVPAGVTLGAFAAVAIAAMMIVDGSGVPSVTTCALLAALMIAGAFGAVLGAHLIAHVVLAFGQRLLLAISAAIALRAGTHKTCVRRHIPRRSGSETIRLLTAACGFRGPPSFVH